MTHYNTIYRHDKRIVIDDNGLDYLVSLEQKINKLVCERDTYKAKLNMVKDLVMNSDKYSDSDFEGCVFQNDILDIIGGDINDR